MSEPEHIKDILPGVLANIAERMKRYSEEHRRGVLSAVADYHKHRRRGRPKAKLGEVLTAMSKRGKQEYGSSGGAIPDSRHGAYRRLYDKAMSGHSMRAVEPETTTTLLAGEI